jgi:hypothetical protein
VHTDRARLPEEREPRPIVSGSYAFGHLSVSAAFAAAVELDEAELDVTADDEALAVGVAAAAWAIAEPPPMRTPETARVIAIRFSCRRISLTSSRSSDLTQAEAAEEPRGARGGSAERTTGRGYSPAWCSSRTVSTVSASSGRLSGR